MQTRCPQCETRFRVTESQLSAADGYVRCGICEHVFNVHDVAAQPHDSTDDDNLHSHTIEDQTVDRETIPDDLHDDQQSPDEARQDEPVNLFENDDHGHTDQLIPDDLRDTYTYGTHSSTATVLWSIGILLLIATLFVEYLWFNRNQLALIPELQSEIDELCQQFDCERLALRAPSRIELVSRNVYSHPNEKDALMINVTMKNEAPFSQPYPVMKIDFSDIRGSSVASRFFHPGEYLSAEQNSDNGTLLPPGTSSSITMEIQDPGKQAMTYEFDFL